MKSKLDKLSSELHNELVENILPYWTKFMVDDKHGGFYGRRNGLNDIEPRAAKGAILNARILWTYSAAYRLLDDPLYLRLAKRAKEYLLHHFYDCSDGGVFWSVDYSGKPLDRKKQIYALSFVIYGLSEYALATNDSEAADYAMRLYNAIEKYSFDHENNGYMEAFNCDWSPIEDMRLSDKDENESKTMNTHLHILEAYANLFKLTENEKVGASLHNLISIFLEKILDRKSYHLNLFFEDNWINKYHYISYGHDIEASWLLHEAAIELGDEALLEEVENVVPKIAAAAMEGLQSDGSLIYEYKVDEKLIDTDRHWWVQAENVVGNVNLFQYFNDEKALDMAIDCWRYIRQNIVDKANGEWYWSSNAEGVPNIKDDKAGFWKCPYHNGRMCIEIIKRTELIYNS